MLDRLRAWWRSLRGRERAEGERTTRERRTKQSFEYRCAICGTGVGTPDDRCPLCRSSDVVPASEVDTGASGDAPTPAHADVTDTREGDGEPVASSSLAPGRRHHVEASDEETVEKLRAIRAGEAVLRRHADRWTPVEGGFRVETPDGETVVDSREALAECLRRHYEP